MKYIFNGLLFFTFILIGCNNQKTEKEIEHELTEEAAEAIIAKYGLNAGSFNKANINNSSKNSDKKNSLETTPNPVTIKEFEAFVKELSDYQKSKEGRLAKKMNEFAINHKKENYSKKVVDSFFIAIDKEFDTDYYNTFRVKKSDSVFKFSTFN